MLNLIGLKTMQTLLSQDTQLLAPNMELVIITITTLAAAATAPLRQFLKSPTTGAGKIARNESPATVTRRATMRSFGGWPRCSRFYGRLNNF